MKIRLNTGEIRPRGLCSPGMKVWWMSCIPLQIQYRQDTDLLVRYNDNSDYCVPERYDTESQIACSWRGKTPGGIHLARRIAKGAQARPH